MAANQGCVALKQKLCTLSSMAGDLHKHWLFPIPKAHFQVLGLQLAINSFGVIRPFARDAVLEELEAHSKAAWQAERQSQRNTAHRDAAIPFQRVDASRIKLLKQGRLSWTGLLLTPRFRKGPVCGGSTGLRSGVRLSLARNLVPRELL